MVKEDVFFDVLAGFFLGREAAAAVVRRHPVLKADLQVLKEQAVQVDLRHMQGSVRPLQLRRREDLSHGDVDIRHTVFKDGLPAGIRGLLQGHSQVGPVVSGAQDPDITGCIEHIDHAGLDIPVGHIVQGVDVDHRLKDLLVGSPEVSARIAPGDLRKGEGDDGKAPLPADDGAVVEDVRLLAELGDLCELRPGEAGIVPVYDR